MCYTPNSKAPKALSMLSSSQRMEVSSSVAVRINRVLYLGLLNQHSGDDECVRVWNTTSLQCEQVLHSGNQWGQVTTLSWICAEVPNNERYVSICVGTGRGVLYLCPMSKDSTVRQASRRRGIISLTWVLVVSTERCKQYPHL